MLGKRKRGSIKVPANHLSVKSLGRTEEKSVDKMEEHGCYLWSDGEKKPADFKMNSQGIQNELDENLESLNAQMVLLQSQSVGSRSFETQDRARLMIKSRDAVIRDLETLKEREGVDQESKAAIDKASARIKEQLNKKALEEMFMPDVKDLRNSDQLYSVATAPDWMQKSYPGLTENPKQTAMDGITIECKHRDSYKVRPRNPDGSLPDKDVKKQKVHTTITMQRGEDGKLQVNMMLPKRLADVKPKDKAQFVKNAAKDYVDAVFSVTHGKELFEFTSDDPMIPNSGDSDMNLAVFKEAIKKGIKPENIKIDAPAHFDNAQKEMFEAQKSKIVEKYKNFIEEDPDIKAISRHRTGYHSKPGDKVHRELGQEMEKFTREGATPKEDNKVSVSTANDEKAPQAEQSEGVDISITSAGPSK